jgi:hypothetical protein
MSRLAYALETLLHMGGRKGKRLCTLHQLPSMSGEPGAGEYTELKEMPDAA